MEIAKPAIAGTLESSDAQVTVEPGEGGIELSLTSSVMNQYGRQIKATVLETTSESIKAALGAATVDTGTDTDYDVITGNSAIGLEDYIDNVTWIGTLSGSDKPVIIQVFNGLNTEGLKLTMQDKNEGTIPMTFYGHYTDDDLDSPPFKVFYPKKKEKVPEGQQD